MMDRKYRFLFKEDHRIWFVTHLVRHRYFKIFGDGKL